MGPTIYTFFIFFYDNFILCGKVIAYDEVLCTLCLDTFGFSFIHRFFVYQLVRILSIFINFCDGSWSEILTIFRFLILDILWKKNTRFFIVFSSPEFGID